MLSRVGNAIDVKKLNLRLNKTSVLVDASIAVGSDEIIALVGPSGSGKTSLLRVLAGFLTDYSGNVAVLGKSPSSTLATGRLSFGFQEPALLPWLSSEDNAAWLLKMRNEQPPQGLFDELWSWLELEHDVKTKRPSELSGGERQRVSLARTMLVPSDLVLLDEPLSAVDYLRRRRIIAQLRSELRGKNTACIFVTHDIPDAIQFADRVVFAVAKNGKFDGEFNVSLSEDRPQDIRETGDFTENVSDLVELLKGVP